MKKQYNITLSKSLLLKQRHNDLLWGGAVVSAVVSTLDSRASAPGSSPGLGHCVVFLSKTLYSHGASLLPGV